MRGPAMQQQRSMRVRVSSAELQAGENKWTYTLVVIRYDGLADVILEGAASLLFPTQSRYGNDAIQRQQSSFIGAYRALNQPIISPFCDVEILRRQIPFTNTFGESVDKHTRCRRLVIITFAIGLIEHLVPQTRDRIL